MTAPVSSANSTFYDPSAQLSTIGCDPSLASCEPNAPGAAAPPEVTIPEVVIHGDAGAHHLVEQLDRAQAGADCSLQAKEAALSCSKAAAAAVAGGAAATTVLGAAAGFALAFFESVECGKDLRAYHDCDSP
jgi:hypothetical protein